MPRLKSPGAMNFFRTWRSDRSHLFFAGLIGGVVALGLLLTLGHRRRGARRRRVRRIVDVAQSRADRDVRPARDERRDAVRHELHGERDHSRRGWPVARSGRRARYQRARGARCREPGGDRRRVAHAAAAHPHQPALQRVAALPAIWSDVAWSLFGTTTWTIQSQGLTFLVAALAGPAAYAPVAAGLVLFSPLRQAVNAFINVFRTDFVAALCRRALPAAQLTIYSVCALICFPAPRRARRSGSPGRCSTRTSSPAIRSRRDAADRCDVRTGGRTLPHLQRAARAYPGGGAFQAVALATTLGGLSASARCRSC